MCSFVPSDSDYFITNPDAGFKMNVHQQGPRGLYYLRSIRSLDLGHCHLSAVPFVANMPHLRHLILADDLVYDISPLENLKELEWLELFNTAVQDPTPLLGCTALRDLNVCYISTPPDALFETLSQMTWLRRLWCTGTYMSDAQVKALREALPNTEVWCSPGDESTGGTWRYDEDYYDMRDAFHMYYMDIKGDTVERMTEDEPRRRPQKILGLLIPGGLPMQEKRTTNRKSSPACWSSARRRRSSCSPPRRGSSSRRYVRLGQQFIPVNAAVLDLRGAGLTDLTPARQVHRSHGAGCA